nr:hypothetical protein [Tanacetum cinerariifolium]
MSSDNAQSTVTYTSISSNSDGPSWGIPLMNAGELPEMDPYEEVAQQGQVHPLSPAYIPDPMELDEHAPVEDDDEDPNEDHESKGSEETEPFEEDEIAITPPPPRHRGARISALQAFERRMMTSIEEVNLRVNYQAQVRRQKSENFYIQLLDAQTDRRDIRLEVDVVRGQRTAYETELKERQSAEDLVVTQMMRIHTLEARARTDTVEDANSSLFHISGYAIDNQVKFATCTLLGAALTWWNGHRGDSLSPFLFILAMEGLHGGMSNLVNSGLIR